MISRGQCDKFGSFLGRRHGGLSVLRIINSKELPRGAVGIPRTAKLAVTRQPSGIPQAALIADQEGVYVFVVDDGKAAVKRVKPGGESGPNVMVDGLSPGDLVIVEGLQSIRPGTPVRMTPAPALSSRN
jgi:hypothetical protein